MTIGNEIKKTTANLVAEIVNGPTSKSNFTMALLNTLVAAAIQIKPNASKGEA